MAKSLSLADVLKGLQKETRVGALSDFDRIPEGFSTGNIAIDWLTGVGGYPKGRIVEQYGPKSSGKTTSALQALAIEQQKCIATGEGYVMFLDYEKTLDEKYIRALGIHPEHHSFLYAMPNTFEEGANAYRDLLRTGELRIAVFDSVAAMITKSETEKDVGAAAVADRAKMLHQMCRMITPILEETKSTAIFLNHMMQKVDTSPMGQRLAAQGIKQITKPGGEALNFYSSLTIEFKQIKHLKSTTFNPITGEKEAVATQTQTKATIVKNKVGNPQGTAELRIRYGKGFSQAYSVLQILVGNKAVKKVGAKYTFPDALAHNGQTVWTGGENAVLNDIENDPEWLEFLRENAQRILEDSGDLMENAEADELTEEEADALNVLDGEE